MLKFTQGHDTALLAVKAGKVVVMGTDEALNKKVEAILQPVTTEIALADADGSEVREITVDDGQLYLDYNEANIFLNTPKDIECEII